MSNPFARPRTTGEWLLGSLCWTVSCLGAWGLLCALTVRLLPDTLDNRLLMMLVVSFGVAHGLIWWRAVAGGDAIIRHDEQHLAFSWTRQWANLWLVALWLLQLVCFLLLLAAILFLLLLLLSASFALDIAPHFG